MSGTPVWKRYRSRTQAAEKLLWRQLGRGERKMMITSSVGTPSNSGKADSQHIWTIGRVLPIIGLGLVPMAAILLQPSVGIIWGTLAIEVVLAIIVVRKWLPTQA